MPTSSTGTDVPVRELSWQETDRAQRIRAARDRADATTRPLIERERFFAGVTLAPP